MKQTVLSTFPEGSAWTPAPDMGMDQLMDGIAENWEAIRAEFEKLAYIRDPQKTPVLADLEREYGFTTDTRLTEQQRRDQLAAFVYSVNGNGSKDQLQNVLIAAGFTTLLVHENSPAIDPRTILEILSSAWLGGENAFLGDVNAFLSSGGGQLRGELVVIGDIYKQKDAYEVVLNGEFSYLGDTNAVTGYFNTSTPELLTWNIPTDPNSWPFIFFIGGTATRDGSGFLTSIAQANVPLVRRTELIRIILRYKPLFTWGALIVNWT